MKRSKYLETLSFEHHEGLVIALKIKNDLNSEHKPVHLIQYVVDIYENGLLHHFHQEEVCFKNVMQDVTEADKLINRMIQEHQQFAGIIENILGPEDKALKQIRLFGELLHDHIRFEERELFPLIEESLTSNQLEEIRIYLHKEHRPLNQHCQV